MVTTLLVLHTCIISVPKRKVHLSTSNIITNCIRISELRAQRGNYHVLAGSSMTGRLPANSASDEAGMPVINLGLDGCGPIEALDFLTNAEQAPDVVLLELNALSSVAPENARAVVEATQGAGYHLRGRVPFLRFEERPVDLLYSWLHSRGKEEASTSITGIQIPAPAVYKTQSALLSDELVELAVQKIRKLQSRGTRVVLVMLPDNGKEHPREYAAAAAIGAQLGLPLMDLKPSLETKLKYTDSVHLDAGSGAQLAAALGRWLREAPPRE